MDISSTACWGLICLIGLFLVLRRPRYDRRTDRNIRYANQWLWVLLGMAIIAFVVTYLAQANPMFLVRVLQR